MGNSNRYYVYEWFVVDTGEVFYVGKGCGNRYKTRKRENRFFMHMLESHVCDVRKVVSKLTEDEAFNKEIELIAYYRNNTDFRLTNILDGGDKPPSTKGMKHSRRTIKQMSVKARDRWNDAEYANKCVSKMKEFYQTAEGKRVARDRYYKIYDTEEKKIKATAKMTETMRSDKFREQHSKIMKSAYSTQDVRDKITGANNGASRSISQYDINGNLLAQYETLMDAHRKTGLDFKNISKALRGHRKTAYGYVWKFNDDKDITYKTRKPYSKDVNRVRKPIVQLDLNGNFVAEYNSIAEAFRDNGFKCITNINQCLSGKSKSAYGYVWAYKEQYIQDNTVPSQLDTQ